MKIMPTNIKRNWVLNLVSGTYPAMDKSSAGMPETLVNSFRWFGPGEGKGIIANLVYGLGGKINI
jgi:hypothetical protein